MFDGSIWEPVGLWAPASCASGVAGKDEEKVNLLQPVTAHGNIEVACG